MKKILALVLALVMLVAMVACASKDTTADKTPADTTPADTTPADTTTEDTTPADTSADTEASELKVGVFYYTFADTYIASVRTAMADAISATAATNADMYTVADGIANKLFVAYAAYTK